MDAESLRQREELEALISEQEDLEEQLLQKCSVYSSVKGVLLEESEKLEAFQQLLIQLQKKDKFVDTGMAWHWRKFLKFQIQLCI